MDPLTSSLVSGGKEWLTLTIVALLPAFWTLSLMLYLGRPYMMRTLRKFGLRFGADVWWLSYVLIRDAVLIVTFVMSFILLLPDLALNMSLPLTGPLAALVLFWALVVKLTRDPDDKARDYKTMTALLVVGAALFLIPLVLGPESNFEDAALTNFLTSQTNQSWALGILIASWVGFAATGGYIFNFVLAKARPSQLRPRTEEVRQVVTK